MNPPDQVQAQLQSLIRAEIADLVLGILITGFGLTALSVHLLRTNSKSRELLWFGSFASLYGIRELIKTPLIHLLLGINGYHGFLIERIIGNFIIVPVLLFVGEIYGRGWHSTLKWLVWFFAAFGLFATAFGLITGRPGETPDAGAIFLLITPVWLFANYWLGYRPPAGMHAGALRFGLTAFLITFVNEHLVLLGVVPWRWQVEPIGFFVLVCSLGYLAVRQNLDNERNLRVLEEEMRSAKRIQTSILPHDVPVVTGAEICVRYLPMTAVAGDLYEFLAIDAQHVGVALADVAGHGVPAALVASMVKVAIGSQSSLATNPPALMAGLNTVMCRQARGNLITGGYLYLDLASRQAAYSAAAHPPLLLRRRSESRTVEFKENGLILGIRPHEVYEAMSFELRSADRILLYTDGIVEASNAADELFGEGRFHKVIAECDHLDAPSFASRIIDEIQAWRGVNSGQADDVTLLVIDCG